MMDTDGLKSEGTGNGSEKIVAVHWFRHGLRLHDNPALLESLKNADEFYPVFIFDGAVAGTAHVGYPRMRFLLECLKDLDESFRKNGSRLFVLHGMPEKVFPKLFQEWGVNRVTFEQDPEPVWQDRDNKVKAICKSYNVECIEKVSHTLWEPAIIIDANGGSPPLTYEMFCQVTRIVGQPPQPCPDPDFSGVSLPGSKGDGDQYKVPTCEDLGVNAESNRQKSPISGYTGGELRALQLLTDRIKKERKAFEKGQCLPNQINPDLVGSPMSLSPHLRFGSLSIRRFYWSIRQAFKEVCRTDEVPNSITGQLIWREYFYCMSVNNPLYNRMEGNPICLDIDWYRDQEHLELWTKGRTGYPWIDACMRQLKDEGWIHHVCRQSVSCFLTRGDLWIDWQLGLEVFDKYLVDADWSVCAGNWMWVSSSAFEKVLQCPRCICPVRYGRRMDPKGDYVRRYVPELKDMPLLYLFEPWKAPVEVQRKAGCIVGQDYPAPMVDHKQASTLCMAKMEKIKSKCKDIPHIAPSSEEEVRTFIWMDTKDMEESTKLCQQHGYHNAHKVSMVR
ncbi:cryptochrome-1-like [Babylonia areolata]|uniref:cryptochrome-1-like n=1 Tax=Babylonia areolata TaxID=304850 RepID=UPI003FD06A63